MIFKRKYKKLQERHQDYIETIHKNILDIAKEVNRIRNQLNDLDKYTKGMLAWQESKMSGIVIKDENDEIKEIVTTQEWEGSPIVFRPNNLK